MSSVPGIDSSTALQNLSIQSTQEEEKKSNELGQSAFLELMITQLNNQNPLDPQDNTEFVAQLAQFSSVEGLERLNTSMDSLVGGFQSSQALQASALVGRSVRVETDVAVLGEGGIISGAIDLDSSTSNLTLNIYDGNGAFIRQVAMGEQAAGSLEFAWDGRDSDGNVLPAGYYRFEALAQQGDESVRMNTNLSANVNSVTLGQNGSMTLNLNGIGPVPMSEVKQIL